MLDQTPEYTAKNGPSTDRVDGLVLDLSEALARLIGQSPIADHHWIALRAGLVNYRKFAGLQ